MPENNQAPWPRRTAPPGPDMPEDLNSPQALELTSARVLSKTLTIVKALGDQGLPLVGPDADPETLFALLLLAVALPMTLGTDPAANIKELKAIVTTIGVDKVRTQLLSLEHL